MENIQNEKTHISLAEALSDFLKIDINDVNLDVNSINHYSYSKESADLDKYSVSGTSFIPLISSHFAISQDDLKEEEISIAEGSIKKIIIEKLSDELLKSKLYSLINFGSGVSGEEKKSPATLRGLVEIIIGIAIAAGYFSDLYWKMETKFLHTKIPTGKDNKTVLQEATQKHRLPMPSYEVISTEGPDHDKVFVVECTISSTLKTTASGKSKRFAESNAALEMMSTHFANHPKKTITLSKLSLEIYKTHLQGRDYKNSAICQNFNIAQGTNLIPCFIPSRFKSTGGWSGRSHRALAFHGANVLDLLLCFFSSEVIKDSPSEAKKIKSDIARRVIKTSELTSIITSEGIWSSNAPFQHIELDSSDEYKSDCIQSLFAVSFFRALESGNIDNLLSSPAANLIQRKVNSQPPSIKSLHENFSSMAVERYSKIGFCYEFKKIDENKTGIKLTHLKSGGEYLQIFDTIEPTNRQKRLSTSRAMLRLIDATEGLLPINETRNTDFSNLNKLSEFLFNSMTGERKKSSTITIIDEIKHETDRQTLEYHDFEIDELVETWANREKLSISQQGELLARIRLWHKVDTKIKPMHQYCFLPVIYDAFFYSNSTKSIVNYDDSPEDFTAESILSPPTQPPTPTAHTSGAIPRTTGAKPNKVQQTEINAVKSAPPINTNSAREYIQLRELQFSKMSVSSLESLWRERSTILESAEEAALLLSTLRFEKGIDFHKINYSSLISTDTIIKLELPSIFASNTHAISLDKAPLENDSPKEFKLDKSDSRLRKNSQITTRPGQSNFRNTVFTNYKFCCITDCTVTTVIEAAHIAPYRGEKDNHIKNGVLLRTDIHRLFDANMIGISPNNLEVFVSEKLKGTEYEQYAGKIISKGIKTDPAYSALKYRWEYFCENNNIEISD